MSLDKSQWGYEEGNPSHSVETEQEFNSENLTECLNHFHDTKDITPLENAIYLNSGKIENLTKELQFLIDKARDGGLDYYANKLIGIRNKLNS